MTSASAGMAAGGAFAPGRWVRRHNDLWLAIAMGGVLALMMLSLPMEAALVTALIGAFVIFALVDTRVALLSLLFVRSIIDVTAHVPVAGSEGAFGLNAAALMSFLVIGMGAAHISLTRMDIWRIPLVKPFLAYLLIAGGGIILAPAPGLALEDWLRTVSAFLVYVLVIDVMGDARDSRWLVRILVASTVVPVIVGMYQFFTDSGNHSTDGFNRLQGTFTHPAPYAFFLVGLLPLVALYFIHTPSRLARVALMALIPLMIFCVYASQTRGAWVGLAVLATVFLAVRARWAVMLVPLLAIALFAAVPSIQARFDEAGSDTGSVVWRQHQWERSLETASPVQIATIGAGLRSVDARLGEFTHNEYIRLLTETGVAGLAAVLIMNIALLRIAIRGYREAATPFERDLMLAFLMAFTARAVTAFADNILVFPVLEWYFWSFAGLIVVTSGAYRRGRAHLPRTAAREAEARAAE